MLADIIHQIAEMGQEADHAYYPRPSLAGPDRCIRQMVYWGLGFKRTPLPGRSLVILSDSSFHEDLTMDWLRKSAYKIHSEQMEVECRAPMRFGHIDFLFTGIDDIDRLCEHKAINHFTFQKYWDGEVPQDYLTQTCIYLDGLRKVSPLLTEAVLLIKNKNTAAYLEYFLELSGEDCLVKSRTNSIGETKKMDLTFPQIVTTARDKFLSVESLIAEKRLPKRPYDIDDWHCNYCGWGGMCWDGYDKEFLELKTDAMLPNEVADLVRYYKELGAQQKDMKGEYEGLRDKIRNIMKESGAREGRAGEYICRLKLDKAGRERLYISNPKEGKDEVSAASD
jgi:hypothetical protein